VTSPLENLSGPGRSLKKEPPDAKEFAGLRRSAIARLTDSAKSSNSLESRFDLAYNAAHALCLAALLGGTKLTSGGPISREIDRYSLDFAMERVCGGDISINAGFFSEFRRCFLQPLQIFPQTLTLGGIALE
jgi:hypothetical protein